MQNDSSKSLKEITSKIGSGATPRGGNNNYKSSGISLIRSQNIHDFKFSYDGLAFIDDTQAKELKNVEVLENDILLNITGDSIARVCIVPNEVLPARVNQHVSIVRCKDKEDAEYVLCYLQFLKKHLLSICKVGGTRNALTKDAVEKIRIKLRPNHKLLGKYIKQINTKIALNNRINRELEAMAKTLYDYWFVQFDFPCLPSDYSPARYANAGSPSGQVNPNSDLAQKIIAFSTYTKVGGLPLPDGKQWFVYVILCEDGSFYKGMTNDLYRRFYEHYSGQGADWTKTHKPKKIIHWEQFNSQDEARIREEELKTGFGRTWLQREYEKFKKYGYKAIDGLPAHQTRLMPAGKMVYNAELKREIPEGWEVKKLSEIESNIITGKTPSTKIPENFGGNIPFITIDDIRGQLFILSAERTLSKMGADSQPTKYLKKGDVCVSCIGTIGVIGLVHQISQTNQQINTISIQKSHNRSFLLNALKNYFDFNVAAKKGAVLSNMSKAEFSDIPILDSKSKIKEEFNILAEAIYNQVEINLKQNQQLSELRDWLLPMLMNGQVVSTGSTTVKEAEESLSSSAERSRSMAAEPSVEYKKG